MSQTRSSVGRPTGRASGIAGLVLLLLAVGGLVACTNLAQTSVQHATESSNPWLTTGELERAIALRKSLGLRTDDAWLTSVATNPEAVANATRYSIPITNLEVGAITDRDAILADLQQFGTAHAAAWGGYYFDGETVVVLLLDPNEDLAKELRAAVPGRLAVERARWSLDDLNALANRIADDPWLQTRYQLLSAGADIEHNRVAIEVSTTDESVPLKIAAHYSLGDELVVTIDGTGPGSEPPNG